MTRKPRKKAKEKRIARILKPVQEPIKSFVSLREIKLSDSKWELEAAGRVAYEGFIHGIDMKIGQLVSDEKGVHRISTWDNLTTFRRARWRTLAQKVIDAAIGTARKEPA